MEKGVMIIFTTAVDNLCSEERNHMGEHYSAVAPQVQSHLQDLVKTAGLGENRKVSEQK